MGPELITEVESMAARAGQDVRSKLKKNPAFPEDDCSPNVFPILRRVLRLPSRLGNRLDHTS
jgi:hypothetical protein